MDGQLGREGLILHHDNGTIEVQILDVTSVGFICGCNLREKLEGSNGIRKGTISHQIRISRGGDRQKIC